MMLHIRLPLERELTLLGLQLFYPDFGVSKKEMTGSNLSSLLYPQTGIRLVAAPVILIFMSCLHTQCAASCSSISCYL